MNPPALLEDQVSTTNVLDHVDAIEEMRLRTWARRNFVVAAERDADWHPVILDEMSRMDGEPSEG